MGQGNIVVFSFGTFFGKVFSKDRIPVADVLGCVVKGMSQVAGATFFHVSIAVREFSGLVCRWRAASVSKNFVRRTEIGEIPDFCKDHSSGVYSHAGNRENWWIELIYDFLNRIFNFVDLGGKFLNEFIVILIMAVLSVVAIRFGYKALLIEWAIDAISKAEKEFVGTKLGEARLAVVVSWLREKVPAPIRFLVTDDLIRKAVQTSFNAAKSGLEVLKNA